MASKTTALNIRIAPDDRYALELVARKRGMNLSQVILKSLQKTFEEEGLTTEEEDGICLLDKLWHESESVRIQLLAQYASGLMTREEKRILQHIWEFTKSKEELVPTEDGRIIIKNQVSNEEMDKEIARFRADGKA